MEITGKVVHVLPVQTGKSAKGEWKKQEFILELPGNYAKKVCISLFGEKLDRYKVATGDQIKAAVNVESREYQGKWFTNVEAWKIDKETGVEAPEEDTSGGLPF